MWFGEEGRAWGQVDWDNEGNRSSHFGLEIYFQQGERQIRTVWNEWDKAIAQKIR